MVLAKIIEDTANGIEIKGKARLAIAKTFDSMIEDLQARIDAMKDGGAEPTIDDLDVSNNRLTAEQYERLFKTINDGGARVLRIHMSGMSTLNDAALQHVTNHLRLCTNERVPMVVDLSDGAITSDGFAFLISAIDENALYPLHDAATGEKIPLHLRMENNFIEDGLIQEYLDAGTLRAYSKKGIGARLVTDETHRIDFVISGFGQKEAHQAQKVYVAAPRPVVTTAAGFPYIAGPGKGLQKGVKRTICKFWQQGTCEKGDDCTWAHGEDEFGAPAPFDDMAPAVSSRVFGGLGMPIGRGGFGKGENMGFASHAGGVHGKGVHLLLERPGGQVGVKRTICKFWTLGSCDRGDACTFAHGEEEFGAPAPFDAPVLARVPAPWENKPPKGLGKGLGGPGVGVKRTICKFWLEGKCAKDPCTFAHGEEEFGAPAPFDSPQPMQFQAAAPPQHYGLGKGGADPVRRTMCKFWLEGKCQKGEGQCTWAHGDDELGTPTAQRSAPY